MVPTWVSQGTLPLRRHISVQQQSYERSLVIQIQVQITALSPPSGVSLGKSPHLSVPPETLKLLPRVWVN